MRLCVGNRQCPCAGAYLPVVEAGRAQRSVARLQAAAVLAAALPPPGERPLPSPGAQPQAPRPGGGDLLPAPSPVFRFADAGVHTQGSVCRDDQHPQKGLRVGH